MQITNRPPLTEVIFSQSMGTPFTGTTTRQTLAAVLLPAGLIGPNTSIEIEVAFGFTASTNSKTVDVAIGPTTGTATSIWNRTRNGATTVAEAPKITLACRNALNAQVLPYGANSSYGSNLTLAPETRAIDFALDQVLWFFGTTANSTETIRLDHAVVTLKNPRR